MKTQQRKKELLILYLGVFVLFGGLSLYLANATPEGATISGTPTVDSGPNKTAGTRTDDGGRIITLTLNLEQQTDAWKAYVGNVTGKYVLQNSNNFSIYEWPSGTSITGEVYASRNNSVNFTGGAISCANNSEMVTEQTALGLSNSITYNINNTFNSTNHSAFSAGAGNSLAENSCRSIALWVNDTIQTPSSSAVSQEVALHDGNVLVYASIIDNDRTGFDNTTIYDFQAIVAENASSTGTPYYFYLELVS